MPVEELLTGQETIAYWATINVANRIQCYLDSHPNCSYEQLLQDAVQQYLDRVAQQEPDWVSVLEFNEEYS
jgi:hypothetical protein